MSSIIQAQPLRRIIHIDMDAFYASVEQRDDTGLRGRPVAVGGRRERGVVAAASYEARRLGVRSAMPSITAKRQCPDLVFVPPRFDVYKAVSAQIHAVFARYTTLIQPLSLDEAYLDVTAPLLDRGSATAIAAEIRAAIRAETGLTASAGVSNGDGEGEIRRLPADHPQPVRCAPGCLARGAGADQPGSAAAMLPATPWHPPARRHDLQPHRRRPGNSAAIKFHARHRS